ncbi:MAG: AAA family ATPase [Thermofilaceae archaeon]|nr:AAA family ATPase [Thermofilaceae archaeon]MDW8004909.1 AAA family ATPase [Thermofilaceae archaeon]
MLCLSKTIYDTHVSAKGTGSLLVAIIIGEPGSGKTSYALAVAKEVYKELGYVDPWQHAVRHTFVTFQQYGEWSKRMLDRYKRWTEGGCKEKYEKTPVIVIDDLFGQQLDRYGWREKQVQSFSAIFNMIRSLTSAVLLTTPVREDVVRALRSKANYIISLKYIDENKREARGYQRHVNVLGEERFLLTFIDYFRVDNIPLHVRAALERERAAALEKEHQQLTQLFDMVEERQVTGDGVASFIEKMCETGPGCKEQGLDLYEAYLEYAKLKGYLEPLGRNRFYDALREAGYPSYRAAGAIWFRGIRLLKPGRA